MEGKVEKLKNNPETELKFLGQHFIVGGVLLAIWGGAALQDPGSNSADHDWGLLMSGAGVGGVLTGVATFLRGKHLSRKHSLER
ncbi:hypothetical protein A2841_03415 [Candidatus Kaiserbacteria bacterium RIFCSPHIGHO2_01_FULL_48_10]|uniref:Uncharacterized protein n=1 Tax=Candidatus Kaiserbacteria bacterium RIFCSPHIGHO2_01_FULL_48_10 TaxID=1798476 RepID=A0A1F6CC05_9BACT|nr:MAG: hypothetical protein A2841_03415 [Candidatus Kaiserbacteria bacterium RIFCSPHIGHO2_01_FULL_48_10]